MTFKRNDWIEYRDACLAKAIELDLVRQKHLDDYSTYISLSVAIEEYILIAQDAEREANKRTLCFT